MVDVKDVRRLLERAEAAGVAGQLEAQFPQELNAFEHGDEGLVGQEQLEAIAQAARELLGDPAGRRYFVTEITFQVLSEDAPVPADLDIAEIYEETVSGDWSGKETNRSVRETGSAEMASLLQEQGSDPSFFRLSDEGDEGD